MVSATRSVSAARAAASCIEEMTRDETRSATYESLSHQPSTPRDMPRYASGTVFHDGKPRVVEIR